MNTPLSKRVAALLRYVYFISKYPHFHNNYLVDVCNQYYLVLTFLISWQSNLSLKVTNLIFNKSLLSFFFRDTESIYEVMAVSIENLLCSSASGRRHCVTERRESYKELKYPSSDHENTCGGGSGGQWDSNTTNSSVQESVERNR